MIPNWDEELKEIFKDPLFADIKSQKHKAKSIDKLIEGFLEITEYVKANGSKPTENGGNDERRLFRMLKGIQEDQRKTARCIPFDKLGLLTSDRLIDGIKDSIRIPNECQQKETDILTEIFNDPIFDDSSEAAGIFSIPEYMSHTLKNRKEAEYRGRFTPCRDFQHFEPGFLEIKCGLDSGKYKLIKFSEQHLKSGNYFIENGMMLYIAAIDELKKNEYQRNDGRMRIIYDNGMESDVKYRTLTKNLSVTGYSIINISKLRHDEFDNKFTVTENDVESGFIYVLKSLSNRPEIASIPNLYKIGFTTTSVESRIAGAKEDPTYLCAPVEIVATWKVYNVKSSAFEHLIHKLFSATRLNIAVYRQHPKEWFSVPLQIIKEAILSIINGQPISYDHKVQKLIYEG